MKTNYPEYQKELQSLSRELGAEIGQTLAGFGQMHKAGMAAGALDVKSKELIALGIAIAARCGGCIAFHTDAALKGGATRQEVVETIGVALVMGGGPSMIYGCEALAALNQYTNKG